MEAAQFDFCGKLFIVPRLNKYRNYITRVKAVFEAKLKRYTALLFFAALVFVGNNLVHDLDHIQSDQAVDQIECDNCHHSEVQLAFKARPLPALFTGNGQLQSGLFSAALISRFTSYISRAPPVC